ncbi:recombination protein RecR [bacterium]|nr:recombination protein RecR [bacterium]
MARFQVAAQHPYGPSVGQLVDRLAALPGIGRKSAERLAQHLLGCDEAEALALAQAIQDVRHNVKHCPNCFNLTEDAECEICRDSRRDPQVVCVVEQPKDLLVIEATGVFQGQYHVLGGRISPLSGVGPDDLNIAALVRRVRKQGVREIVMGTNPTLEGDGTALYISNLLADDNVRITRLARGIASGSVLEFANREMLADAMKGRQAF